MRTTLELNLPTNLPSISAGIELTELFEAYAACRINKRGTMNAIAFEVDYERELLKLWEDIHAGRYQPGRSIAFVVNKPVKREIFAADFRDRVVHHLVINKLNPLFERIFIKDSKRSLDAAQRNQGFINETNPVTFRNPRHLRERMHGQLSKEFCSGWNIFLYRHIEK
jgi:hypothetical protein